MTKVRVSVVRQSKRASTMTSGRSIKYESAFALPRAFSYIHCEDSVDRRSGNQYSRPVAIAASSLAVLSCGPGPYVRLDGSHGVCRHLALATSRPGNDPWSGKLQWRTSTGAARIQCTARLCRRRGYRWISSGDRDGRSQRDNRRTR